MINRVREMLKPYDPSLAKHSRGGKSHLHVSVIGAAKTGRCERLHQI